MCRGSVSSAPPCSGGRVSTATASRRRGRGRELQWVAWRREQGWVAYRVDGAGDIVEGKDGVTNLIQCKSTVTPYAHFQPADRERLIVEAAAAGWRPFLLWWPKGRGISKARLIPADEWPHVGRS